MAQVSLDIFDIIAGLQRIDGKAVSQIVKAIVGQFRPFQDFFVMLDDRSLHKIFAELCGEDEVVGVTPLLAQHGAVIILFFFFLPQRIHHNRRYRKGAGIAILGCAEEILTIFIYSRICSSKFVANVPVAVSNSRLSGAFSVMQYRRC